MLYLIEITYSYCLKEKYLKNLVKPIHVMSRSFLLGVLFLFVVGASSYMNNMEKYGDERTATMFKRDVVRKVCING